MKQLNKKSCSFLLSYVKEKVKKRNIRCHLVSRKSMLLIKHEPEWGSLYKFAISIHIIENEFKLVFYNMNGRDETYNCEKEFDPYCEKSFDDAIDCIIGWYNMAYLGLDE